MQYDLIINVEKQGLFMGQKYLRMEDQKPGPRLVGKQGVAKEGGLKPKVNVFKIGIKLWRRGEEINVIQTITHGDLGTGPQPPEAMGRLLGNFCNFIYFNAIWITFCTFFYLFERTKFLRFESQLKNLICSVFLFLQCAFNT